MPTRDRSLRLGAGSRCLLAASVLFVGSPTEAAPERPAASVGDLRDHFASCFRPPTLAANTRVTFYFSLNNRGDLIGPPRTVWFGYTGAEPEKEKELTKFAASFDKCLPVALDREMGEAIPGEVYYLQYVVGPDGHDQQVLLRPFGSHGGVGPPVGRLRGPVESVARPIGPPPRPFEAFRPHPGRGAFFHPPIVPPIPRLRLRRHLPLNR